MPKSRRKAREAALQTLYKLDITRGSIFHALQELDDNNEDLAPELRAYARKIVETLAENKEEIDSRLEGLIPGYDYSRVATVDRNVLRIASYEFFYEPSIPPPVTIDEAIEIAKKYSTEESGKFVHGVLRELFLISPKRDWDAATAPKEEFEEPEEEYVMEVTEETLDIESEEAKKLSRIGGWKLRTEDPS